MKSKQDVIDLIFSSIDHALGGRIKSNNIETNGLGYLKELTVKNICYPNGDLHDQKILKDDTNQIGKPHDIECRFALSFFHKHKLSLNGNIGIQVISDLGLVRNLYSPQELALLLANEMEGLLWRQRDESFPRDDSFHPVIKAVKGIITIVSPGRVAYLRKIGRLPCSHPQCLSWAKGGTKGLWWHELNQHQLAYGTAVARAEATSGDHERALVVYNSTCHRNEDVPPLTSSNDDKYFQCVKAGDFDRFKAFLDDPLIEQRYDACTYLDRNGASALHWAAGCGHLKMVRFLIEHKSCPPDQGQKGKRSFRNRTPLHWAARNNHLHVVQYLLQDCAVNVDSTTIDGTTAFCWACWQGNLSIMKYLAQMGANVNTVNNFGCNAALWCAQSDNFCLDAIKWLSFVGVDLTIVNGNGHSILHKAAQRGNKEFIQWSLEENSNMKNRGGLIHLIAPDDQNCTPSDLAGMQGFEVAKLLVDYEIEIVLRSNENEIRECEWLQNAIQQSKYATNRVGLEHLYEPGAGVKKIGVVLWNLNS